MNAIEQKYNSAGWSVEYRRDRVCVVRGSNTLLVCYKYVGGWGYEKELEAAYEAMVSKGYIESEPKPAPVSISYGNNRDQERYLSYLNSSMQLVEDTVFKCLENKK